ncbi:deoxyuridine 5'-triphosphate nucleotidohydrolase [Sporobacter termitidis DSM 10068]|uniref:dUTP diphosphatase n=1 Tax=Sporobacter termitidis DSM 10068 TaxID=1123282 RepID=A0A1M5WD28_9FIRM|nr:dUTP diphosphatase [Sporobacter termitidis]SHH85113.1 deoxyuridine 5'-triphosphate nucleotidohydrolase [Sporobacter termitidis DSM 10068]
MEKKIVRLKKLRPDAVVPAYGSPFSAGADLCACIDGPVTVAPGETVMVPTGLMLELPEGHAGLVCARSGLASKRGLAPANKIGVIDSDYRGEVIVALFNHSREAQTIVPGERVAQLVVTPVAACVFEESALLSETARGSGGFGSTGRV